METLIDRRNQLSKELDFARFELRNTCVYPEDRQAQSRKVRCLETELDKVIIQINDMENTAKKEELRKKLKEIHQYIQIDQIPVGCILPSGKLSVDGNLKVKGTLLCGHAIDVSLFDLLKTTDIENLLNPSVSDISTFFPCSVKTHDSDRHWQPVTSHGRAYKLVFRLAFK